MAILNINVPEAIKDNPDALQQVIDQLIAAVQDLEGTAGGGGGGEGDTTYNLEATDGTGDIDVFLQLDGSDGTSDRVGMIAGAGVTIVETNGNIGFSISSDITGDFVTFNSATGEIQTESTTFQYLYPFLHIRFSTTENGDDFVTNPQDIPGTSIYIGVSNTQSAVAPTEPSSYQWTEFSWGAANFVYYQTTGGGRIAFITSTNSDRTDAIMFVDGDSPLELDLLKVNTDNVEDGAVTFNKISVSELSAITSNVGELTAGIIKGGNLNDDDPTNNLPDATGSYLNLTNGDVLFGNSNTYFHYDATADRVDVIGGLRTTDGLEWNDTNEQFSVNSNTTIDDGDKYFAQGIIADDSGNFFLGHARSVSLTDREVDFTDTTGISINAEGDTAFFGELYGQWQFSSYNSDVIGFDAGSSELRANTTGANILANLVDEEAFANRDTSNTGNVVFSTDNGGLVVANVDTNSGNITGVGAGTGISVDNTDPAVPVVSSNIFNNNQGTGILIDGTNQAVSVDRSNAYNASTGITIDDTSGDISSNIFNNNQGTGILIDGTNQAVSVDRANAYNAGTGITIDDTSGEIASNTSNVNALPDLTDVSDDLSPTNDQVFTYDGNNSLWTARDAQGGGGAANLPELGDVSDLLAPDDAQVLTYSSNSGEWIARDPQGGGGGGGTWQFTTGGDGLQGAGNLSNNDSLSLNAGTYAIAFDEIRGVNASRTFAFTGTSSDAAGAVNTELTRPFGTGQFNATRLIIDGNVITAGQSFDSVTNTAGNASVTVRSSAGLFPQSKLGELVSMTQSTPNSPSGNGFNWSGATNNIAINASIVGQTSGGTLNVQGANDIEIVANTSTEQFEGIIFSYENADSFILDAPTGFVDGEDMLTTVTVNNGAPTMLAFERPTQIGSNTPFNNSAIGFPVGLGLAGDDLLRDVTPKMVTEVDPSRVTVVDDFGNTAVQLFSPFRFNVPNDLNSAAVYQFTDDDLAVSENAANGTNATRFSRVFITSETEPGVQGGWYGGTGTNLGTYSIFDKQTEDWDSYGQYEFTVAPEDGSNTNFIATTTNKFGESLQESDAIIADHPFPRTFNDTNQAGSVQTNDIFQPGLLFINATSPFEIAGEFYLLDEPTSFNSSRVTEFTNAAVEYQYKEIT